MSIQRGMTLVELLVTITVIAVAGLALVGTMGYLAGNSGDSIAQMQAHAIADAYLSETLANSFPAVANRTATEGPMQVSVAVSNSGALFNVPAAAAKRVDVTVTMASGQRVIATGYRLSYP
jgi:prepilin-type N-terminal cleavage/methylation domain-containing protein